MCGINGIIYKESHSPIQNDLKRMNDLIIHRGPDDEGIYFETGNFNVALGMRRLSIIDLQKGSQPMRSDDDNIILTFNGEIYNFRELKKELLKKGVSFKTDSDTEIILKLYEVYGPRSFSKLDGMYAFCIYDKILKKVFLARDFFGEKPLYYYKNSNGLYWASELKSIIDIAGKQFEINLKALHLYFQLTYIPYPYTIYQDIYKLEPNTLLEYNLLNNEIIKHTIHGLTKQKKLDISEQEAKDICFHKVMESVKS